MNTTHAYILAGGLSSRMGADKGLLLLHNKPMIQYVIEAVRPVVPSITILTANTKYKQFGYELLRDNVPNLGPAGGIATALQHSRAEQNFIISCDTPFITTSVIEYILSHAQQTQITIPQHNNKLHPLCGVYATTCSEQWQQHIQQGERKLQQLIQHFSLNILDCNSFQPNTFTNINTPQEFEQAQQII